MYPAAVSGLNENNERFSSCSKNNILPVLQKKATCFVTMQVDFCGNFEVSSRTLALAVFIFITGCFNTVYRIHAYGGQENGKFSILYL